MPDRQYSPQGRTQGRFIVTASRLPNDPKVLIEIRDMGGPGHRYFFNTSDVEISPDTKIEREVDGARITVTKGSAPTGEWLEVHIDIGDEFDHSTAVALP